VPLSSDAVALLAALPRFANDDFLFSTTMGKTPVNGFSKAKARLDKLIKGEMTGWVLHDLRRTVRTRLSSLRVPEPVAEMVIGHARKGLARVYNQHQYLDEMREALELWAGRLRDIVTPPPANVVKLKAKA
jgi:integrase